MSTSRSRAISGRPSAFELGIEKAKIERRIVDDKRRIAEKGDQVVSRFGKKRLVLEELLAQAVNREGLRRHAAFRIEVSVERVAGRDAIDQLDTADLDQAMAIQRVETGRLGIKHDFAH